MMTKCLLGRLLVRLLLVAAFCSLCLAARAQNNFDNYIGPLGGLWSAGSNWDRHVPPGDNDRIILDEAGGTITNDDIGSLSVENILFGPGTNILTINSGNSLTIFGEISGSALIQVQNANTELVLADNVLTADQTVEFDVTTGGKLAITQDATLGALAGGGGTVALSDAGAKTLYVGALNTDTTFGGTINGSGGALVKVGTGTLGLNQASTYTGGTTIQAGVLAIANDNALSTGGVTIGQSGGGNASLRLDPTIGTVANNITVAAVANGSTAAINAVGGSPATINLIGTLTLNGNLSLQSAAPIDNPLTVSGQITGSGALNLNNPSTTFADAVQLTNSSNNYSGGTSVTAGTLFLSNTSGSATGTNSVSVGNGASIGGNGFMSGPLTINSGGTLAPGFNGPGTFHIGSGGLILGGTLSLQIGGITAGSSYDQVQTAGGAIVAGQLGIAIVNNFQPVLGEPFYILDNTSLDPSKTTSGAFTNGNAVMDNRGNTYVILFGQTDPNKPSGFFGTDIELLTVGVVPEPSSGMLCLIGVTVFLILRNLDLHRRWLSALLRMGA